MYSEGERGKKVRKQEWGKDSEIERGENEENINGENMEEEKERETEGNKNGKIYYKAGWKKKEKCGEKIRKAKLGAYISPQ